MLYAVQGLQESTVTSVGAPSDRPAAPADPPSRETPFSPPVLGVSTLPPEASLPFAPAVPPVPIRPPVEFALPPESMLAAPAVELVPALFAPRDPSGLELSLLDVQAPTNQSAGTAIGARRIAR